MSDRLSPQGRTTRTSNRDLVGRIIDFEAELLTDEETLELFQELVDTGIAWQLQGFYGRAAASLIEQGLVQATTPVR